MSNEWSQSEIMKFLELYKNESVIWNPNNFQHKDKLNKNKAWVRLSVSMNRSVSELKRKKDSFMATFRGLLRKKRAAIAENDFSYKPGWFAFDFLEEFLAPVTASSALPSAGQAMAFDFLDDATVENSLSGLSNEEIDFDTELVPKNELVSNSNSSTPEESAAPSQTTGEHPEPELSEAEIQISDSFTIVKDALKHGSQKEYDNCDFYGKMVSQKLKKLKGTKRQFLMQQIDRLDEPHVTQNIEDPLDIKDESSLFCDLLRLKLNSLDEYTRQVAMNKIDNLMFSFKKPKMSIENEYSPYPSVNNHLPTSPILNSYDDSNSQEQKPIRLNRSNGWFVNKN